MKYAFNYLLLLAFVLLSNVAVAQTQPSINSNQTSVTEKQKQKLADMTVAEFLKTPKGMALSDQEKADLNKIPSETKMSEVIEKQKQKFIDMTLAEFLKTPKGMALSDQEKADLGKIPSETKMSKIIEELKSDSPSSGVANSPNVNFSYSSSYYSQRYKISQETCCWYGLGCCDPLYYLH